MSADREFGRFCQSWSCFHCRILISMYTNLLGTLQIHHQTQRLVCRTGRRRGPSTCDVDAVDDCRCRPTASLVDSAHLGRVFTADYSLNMYTHHLGTLQIHHQTQRLVRTTRRRRGPTHEYRHSTEGQHTWHAPRQLTLKASGWQSKAMAVPRVDLELG